MDLVVRSAQSTGIVYHEEMMNHLCLWDPKYTECPERFAVILKRCEALNLLNRCVKIPGRLAEAEEITWIHSPELLKLLKSCESKSVLELEEFSSRYDFIYFCNATYHLALLAAGSVMNLVEAVCRDQVKNGMAVIRPPGHHAMKTAFCGYCYLNNVALAANYALRNLDVSKILIVDWDVHHGQATQQMFYNDPRVLYFSIHRFEDGKHWPNLRESNADHVGEDEGKGFNINVPLNSIGLGNADYLTIFHQILLPVAIEFQPDLILISAGYDAALGCPEGEMEVTPACYAHFVQSLSQLANGRLAVVLEGGYCLKSLAEGAALTLRALLGDPCPMIEPISEVDNRTKETIMNVINYQKKYWKCFQIYDTGTHDPTNDLQATNHFYSTLKFEFDKYPTRDVCPVHDEKTEAHYDSLLNKLIEGTVLYRPKLRCSMYCSADDPEMLAQIQNDYVESITAFSKLDQLVSTVLERISSKEINSAVIDENSLRHFNCDAYCRNKLVEIFVEKLKFKKIMLVTFGSVENTLIDVENLLHFSFDPKFSLNDQENDFFVHFSACTNDNDYITAWFKILFPLAYQFSPELLLVYINFRDLDLENNVSIELLPHFLHWLTSFSSGKIVLVINYNKQDGKQQQSVILCCHCLLGANLPSMKKKNNLNFSKPFISDLKRSCHRLQKSWKNLDYFISYPD